MEEMCSKVIIPNNLNFRTWNIINDSGGFQIYISFWNLKILFFLIGLMPKLLTYVITQVALFHLYVFIDTYLSCVTSHGISSNMYNTYIVNVTFYTEVIKIRRFPARKSLSINMWNLIIIFWLRCSAKYSPLVIHALSPERRSCDAGDIWMSSE